MEALSLRETRKLLDCVKDIGTDCKPEALSSHLVQALSKLIQSIRFSYNHLNKSIQVQELIWDSGYFLNSPAEQTAILQSHNLEHPHAWAKAEGFSFPVADISDTPNQRQAYKTELNNEFFRPLSKENQLVVGVHTANNSILLLSYSLSHRDFTAKEAHLLSLVTPHIQQCIVRCEKQARISQQLEMLQNYCNRSEKALTPLNRDGDILWMSDRAQRLLRQYFNTNSGKKKNLPAQLTHWVNRQLKKRHLNIPIQPLRISRAKTILKVGISMSDDLGAVLELSETHKFLPEHIRQCFGLTKREEEVLNWLNKGKQNLEIAGILSISVATVKKHLEHLYNKLGVDNRLAAVGRIRQTS